jgi:GWxTD domain-containing protein
MMKKGSNIVIGFLLLLTGPAFAQKLSKTDLAGMYSEYQFTQLEPMVYHASEDSSTIFLRINLHHFAYLPNASGRQQANFRVNYSLYPSYGVKAPLEKGMHRYSDTLFAGEVMEMAVDFKVKAPYPSFHVLKIDLTDENQPENHVSSVIHLKKESKFSSQNFFLSDGDGYPLFSKYILGESLFSITYNNPDGQQLVIRYYNQDFPIAKPPFATEKNVTYSFEPDSFYTVVLDAGISPLLELPYQGIYHIQADQAQPEGLTLFRFDNGFPEVTIPAMALAPLRYLTTEREFEHLLSYRDYKVAVDSFWLERASYDPGRAKNMIKRFYQRVEDVNSLFSSYQEGWKTDRGLLYIIYGPPSEVYRKDGEEEWIYGERGNPMSIRFYFNQVDNPFTSNDYSLQRSSVYKTSWYIAVENWRR